MYMENKIKCQSMKIFTGHKPMSLLDVHVTHWSLNTTACIFQDVTQWRIDFDQSYERRFGIFQSFRYFSNGLF